MTQPFKHISSEKFGNVTAQLYSCSKDSGILEYIQNKINSSPKNLERILEKYAGQSCNKENILKSYKKRLVPKNHEIPVFDVKYSTVTEFMAEFLLEKEFQCIFYENINKKIKDPVYAKHHSPGIDVVGLRDKKNEEDEMKFVIAEVKASSELKIPCGSAKDLKNQVASALDFNNGRLEDEIFRVVGLLDKKTPDSDSDSDSERQKQYIKMLFKIINSQFSKTILVEKIIVFPFLIRNYPEIIKRESLNDFKNFTDLETHGIETIGVLWACNQDIIEFAKEVYHGDT